ncbi:MAG: hypothetical protein U0232_19045 [Thermomicrobiales bacterium]
MARRATIVFTIAILLASFLLAEMPAHSVQASDAYTLRDGDLYLYIPSNAAQHQPVQVLVTMHGMGGDGATFCQNLLAAAERNGWIVVAPTFKYQDYKNADLVLQDDVAFLPRLLGAIDTIPQRTGLETRQKVLLYGPRAARRRSIASRPISRSAPWRWRRCRPVPTPCRSRRCWSMASRRTCRSPSAWRI